MLKNSQIDGLEEIGLVISTPGTLIIELSFINHQALVLFKRIFRNP